MKREIIWVVAILLVVVAAALFANTASVRLVLVVLAVLVLELYLRVKGLEKWVRAAEQHATTDKIDAQEFLRKLRAYHLGRLSQLDASRDDPYEAADDLATALAAERPSLRRVLFLSMSDVAGLCAMWRGSRTPNSTRSMTTLPKCASGPRAN